MGKATQTFMTPLSSPGFTRNRPLIMGIINCTPDSFYSVSRKNDVNAAIRAAAAMEEEGADILDIGGESTRPGSRYIDTEEELERVIPVIRRIRRNSSIVISVDTRKSEVARQACDAGADMINDISALEEDPELADVAAATGVPVVLMHKKGTPENMQNDPHYTDVVGEVKEYLRQRIEYAQSRGIGKHAVLIDPGIGFGKRLIDNLLRLRHLRELNDLGGPVCLGASRKSFLGAVTRGGFGKDSPEERLIGSLAVHSWACMQDAAVLRVHDVAETRELISVLRAIRTAGEE